MYNQFENIEAYLQGNLDAAQTEAFEQAMQEDKSLAEVVKNHDLYSPIADELIDEEISAHIQMAHADRLGPNRSEFNKSIILRLLVVGALAFLAFFFFRNGIQKENDQLFADFYSPPMGLEQRGVDNEPSTLQKCDEAHALLDVKNYEQALLLFKQSLEDKDQRCREKSEFYYSLLLVKNGQSEEAIPLLQKITEQKDHSFLKKTNQLLKKIN